TSPSSTPTSHNPCEIQQSQLNKQLRATSDGGLHETEGPPRTRGLEPQGISVEVLDARSLLPFDHALLESSVNKTGRLVIFDDSNRTCGFAAEIAAYASEHLFYFLKAPIARITRADVPVPFSTVLDKRVLPRAEELEQAIRQLIGANRLEPVPSNRK
ncbi:MAG: hypothetical protein L0312_29400, partial [Acidobacteria bacterium]|nr:hypothetical protein [Acidobacteriota bacterium]